MKMRILSRVALSGLALCLYGAVSVAQAQTDSACASETGYQPTAETGYNSSTDASTWCDRLQEYWTEMLADAKTTSSCSGGTLQSPVALTSRPGWTPEDYRPGEGLRLVYWQPPNLHGYVVPNPPGDLLSRELVNNGHTVAMSLALDAAARADRRDRDRNFVIFGDGVGEGYDAVQIHFHYPSEHILDGERFPLELHLVNESIFTKRRVVIALLVRKGDEANDLLDKVFLNQMPNTKDGKSQRFTLDMKVFADVVPPRGLYSYLTYPGSLTTPTGRRLERPWDDTGCEENVTWLVFTTPLVATQAQIDKFKDAIPHPFKVNARPLTDAQGKVRTSAPRAVRWGYNRQVFWVNFGTRPNITKSAESDTRLSVTLGAGAGPVASSAAYSVPANSNVELRILDTNELAAKDMTLTIRHRTAADGTAAGYAPINITVNETSIKANYDVSAANAGSREAFTDHFTIPAASWKNWKKGHNTLKLATQPGARTNYWIEWLAVD